MNRLAWRCALASAKSAWLEKRSRQRPDALLKLLNIDVGDVHDVKGPHSPGKRKRDGILRSEIPQRLEHSDYPSRFWIVFPD